MSRRLLPAQLPPHIAFIQKPPQLVGIERTLVLADLRREAVATDLSVLTAGGNRWSTATT